MKQNLFTNLPPENASDAAKARHVANYKAPSKAKEKPTATKPKAKPVEITAWQRYRHLQSVDARAAGIFWRANKQAIVDCI